MTHTFTQIEQFIRNYAKHIDSGVVPSIVSCFADPFLAAGPDGAQPVRTADFALALPKRKQHFQSLGAQSFSLVSVQQIPLDPHYVLARTCWRVNFAGPAGPPVEVNSDFLIHMASDTCKIVLYLANQDILAVLRDRSNALPTPASPPDSSSHRTA